jgi:hypothetical protein
MKLVQRLLIAAALAFSFTAPLSACPLCKEGIPEAGRGEEDGHDPDRLSRAYNYSIFAFIGLPFAFAGLLGYGIYRIHKNESAHLPCNG